MTPQPWLRSYRADPHARALADRHYNRQKVGAAQFVPPGRCFLRAGFRRAGTTKGGLIALQLLVDDFPEPLPAREVQPPLWGESA